MERAPFSGLRLGIRRHGQLLGPFNGLDQLRLPAHLEDLLEGKKDQEDVADGVLLHVLLEDCHKLLHLRGGQRANGQANAHDHGANRRAADELDRLEEVRKRLFSVWRLQAVASELISRSRKHTGSHNGCEHVHYSPQHGVSKAWVQGDQEGRHLVSGNPIDDVPQHRWGVRLVEVGWGHRQVHGLTEPVVRDGQRDGAKH
mmetsp:Transcript_7370/g.12800  ORF Transcript_7370/g.12800 Transcript_7370/m.12800 type:complete len:201 (-) Transcript_7370:358-960(-)